MTPPAPLPCAQHRILRWTMLAAALQVIPTGAVAQAPASPFPVATPESVGMSSAALRTAMDSIRAWSERERVMGAILLVMRDGKVVLHEAAGWSDRERGIPLRTDHVVSMRSMTKPLLGAAVMLLVEEGRLGLEDRVSRHLPSFDNDRSREITVFQLLTHTSGLTGAIYNDQDGSGTPYGNLREAVDGVGDRGPTFPPGTGYSYSDPGSSTLGALVEALSGIPSEDFIRLRIMEPLGMADSRLHLEADDPLLPRVAATYRRAGDGWERYWDHSLPLAVPFFRASGGLWSTSLDYARFLAMMHAGGTWNGSRILPAESVELSLQPHAAYVYTPEERAERDRFYGFHWTVYTDRYRPVAPPFSSGIFEHSGSDGTLGWVDPSRGLVLVYLTQSRGQDTRRDLLRLVYDAFTQERP